MLETTTETILGEFIHIFGIKHGFCKKISREKIRHFLFLSPVVTSCVQVCYCSTFLQNEKLFFWSWSPFLTRLTAKTGIFDPENRNKLKILGNKLYKWFLINYWTVILIRILVKSKLKRYYKAGREVGPPFKWKTLIFGRIYGVICINTNAVDARNS